MDVKNVKNVLRKEKHMNKTNKLLSLLLVLTIVFSLSVTALAADTTYSITVDGSGTVANHTFEAYQIFKGDLHAPATGEGGNTSKILSNIVGAPALTPPQRALQRLSPNLPLRQQKSCSPSRTHRPLPKKLPPSSRMSTPIAARRTVPATM